MIDKALWGKVGLNTELPYVTLHSLAEESLNVIGGEDQPSHFLRLRESRRWDLPGYLAKSGMSTGIFAPLLRKTFRSLWRRVIAHNSPHQNCP